jgi:hypothetical protein
MQYANINLVPKQFLEFPTGMSVLYGSEGKASIYLYSASAREILTKTAPKAKTTILHVEVIISYMVVCASLGL